MTLNHSPTPNNSFAGPPAPPTPPTPPTTPPTQRRLTYAEPAFSAPHNATPLSQKFGVLVVEIAARLEPLATILSRHQITRSQWQALSTQPQFIKALAEQISAFSAVSNLPARIKLKAQLLTEVLLDEMHHIAAHPIYPASARVSAFAQVKSLTGLERPEDVAPQRQFTLTINLGEGRIRTAQAITLEAERVRDQTDGPASAADDLDTISPLASMAGATPDVPIDFFADAGSLDSTPAVSPPVQIRTWRSFNAQPGPPLKHPAPDPVSISSAGKPDPV